MNSSSKRLVWVSGQSGAGKTTLGNAFKEHKKWLHFDGDIYSHGGDPIRATGIPTKEMLDKRDPEMIRVYGECVEQTYAALFRGEKPPLEAWTPFYDRMCADVLKTFNEHPESMIVSQAVYLASVRAYISAKLPGLQFIVLDDVNHGAVTRKVQQVKDSAAADGSTLSEFLTKFDPKWANPEKIEERLYDSCFVTQVGLDKAQPGEFGIDVTSSMSKAEVFERACQLLKV